MTRCANAAGAGQRSFGAGSCAQRVMPEPMTASHLLMELLANPLMRLLAIPLSNQKTVAKWLVISQQTTLAKSLVTSTNGVDTSPRSNECWVDSASG